MYVLQYLRNFPLTATHSRQKNLKLAVTLVNNNPSLRHHLIWYINGAIQDHLVVYSKFGGEKFKNAVWDEKTFDLDKNFQHIESVLNASFKRHKNNLEIFYLC